MTIQKRRMMVAIVCAVAVMASIIGVAAQETRERVARVEGQAQTFTYATGGGAGAVQGDNTFVFVSSEMSLDGKVVKGAPYSAQAVTETIQTLAGGNRIVRRNTANLYRDGEGRTRREQTLGAVGAYAASGELQQTIFINDPVAQVNYILEEKSKTARKMDLSMMAARKRNAGEPSKADAIAAAKAEAQESTGVAAEHQQKIADELKVQMARSGGGVMAGPLPAGAVTYGGQFKTEINSKNTRKESLGKQMVEGVEAEGARVITTIAAGEIGNEQPIEIISETWFSPELQTVVMTRRSDPRMGETTYRLTNITRSEPAHSLFEVPSDYTIKESIPAGMKMMLETEMRKPSVQKKDQ
jgi:hypothetical protein